MRADKGHQPKALVTAPLRGEGLERLGRLFDLVIDPWIDTTPLRLYSPEQLAARIEKEDASVVICEADLCSGPVFDQPLSAIASTRGNPTNVDIDGATEAGIPVIKAPGRNADAVAELTVGLLIAATRKVIAADRDVRECEVFRDGTIPYQRFRAWQVAGKTFGIVGMGAVGKATKWRMEGLGLEVIAYDPFSDKATSALEELIERSDVISMHAPLTPETDHMIGREQFDKMRQGAIFINTARAQLHDNSALIDALRSGKLAAAALDHFEGEMLEKGHPLASMDNVVLTPHIGGATYDTETNHTTMVADGLEQLLAGKVPGNLANPEVLDSQACRIASSTVPNIGIR
ncbi:MAG: NAD(P)-dependent oxidoreductase [Acidimicrobiales bacterium]